METTQQLLNILSSEKGANEEIISNRIGSKIMELRNLIKEGNYSDRLSGTTKSNNDCINQFNQFDQFSNWGNFGEFQNY